MLTGHWWLWAYMKNIHRIILDRFESVVVKVMMIRSFCWLLYILSGTIIFFRSAESIICLKCHRHLTLKTIVYASLRWEISQLLETKWPSFNPSQPVYIESSFKRWLCETRQKKCISFMYIGLLTSLCDYKKRKS